MRIEGIIMMIMMIITFIIKSFHIYNYIIVILAKAIYNTVPQRYKIYDTFIWNPWG